MGEKGGSDVNGWKIATVVLGALLAGMIALAGIVAHGLAYPDKGKIV